MPVDVVTIISAVALKNKNKRTFSRLFSIPEIHLPVGGEAQPMGFGRQASTNEIWEASLNL